MSRPIFRASTDTHTIRSMFTGAEKAITNYKAKQYRRGDIVRLVNGEKTYTGKIKYVLRETACITGKDGKDRAIDIMCIKERV